MRYGSIGLIQENIPLVCMGWVSHGSPYCTADCDRATTWTDVYGVAWV